MPYDPYNSVLQRRLAMSLMGGVDLSPGYGNGTPNNLGEGTAGTAALMMPIVNALVGKIKEKRASSQMNNIMQQYGGTPEQTITKPQYGPTQSGGSLPDVTETVPGKSADYEGMIRAMASSNIPEIRQQGQNMFFQNMQNQNILQQKMADQAFQMKLQQQNRDPALQETMRHNRATEAIQSGQVAGFGTPTGASTSQQGQVHGDDFLKTLPTQIGAQVKALAEGRMQFPSGFALKTPYWQQMLSAVSQYDPNFDAINYNARSKTRADFTSGQSSKNLTAINTAIGHMGTLSKAVDALGNGNFTPINYALNLGKSATGQPQIKNFEVARDAVANELMRVFRGVGASEAEVNSWKNTISSSNSPAQLKGSIKQAADLLESRINALSDTYNRGMGTTGDVLQVLAPHSREALNLLEQQSGAGASGNPSGSYGHLWGD